MKIHPIQTGIVRCKQFQLTGAKNNLSRIYQLIFTKKWGEWMPTYCWLIEHSDGLILVDTGETTDIYQEGYLPKGGLYHKAVETKIKREEEIDVQLKKLGYSTTDIKTIILTHLHGDHIGGLKYFSHCDIFVSEKEYQLAISKKGISTGYFKNNWPDWFQPNLIQYSNKKEDVFLQSHSITNDGKIIAVPTPGHSIGHQSILVKNKNKTIFIGGDLTYNINTLQKEIPDVLLFNKESKNTVKKVHQYTKNNPCIYLSSHDWNAPELLKK